MEEARTPRTLRLPCGKRRVREACVDCHEGASAKGGLDLAVLAFDPSEAGSRERWTRIYDRIEKLEMPPKSGDLSAEQRTELLSLLGSSLEAADRADILANGRGPLRRLNREEYEQNLRAVLQLPELDVRDMLPEDRESHHFNKSAETLDMSRVQLAAYLDAAEAALREAMATGMSARKAVTYSARGLQLFSGLDTFGNREAMFFARDDKAVPLTAKEAQELLREGAPDPGLELALFRSAHWPYYGYPRGFVAKQPGSYRVRFSARAVLQTAGHQLKPALAPVPMTFRARKPSGPDVSGDVRATGGILDIQPAVGEFETVIQLRAGETFEYSLLGLPVPLARNVNGGPPTYRYPPLPAEGQPGVAFQKLEVTGPLPPETWPPASHRVLFDNLEMGVPNPSDGLPVNVLSNAPREDARRLMRRFAGLSARAPVEERELERFNDLVFTRLDAGATFAEAMLAGYKAFLCSSHFLYLREPQQPEDHFAIASRLSHWLANSRPDSQLLEHAARGAMRDASVLRSEARRLVRDEAFGRFVKNFTDSWLGLRHIRRDDPDVRLYPEYRFDDYLVESAERETRTFFTALIRENLPARNLVDADFAFINDRLASHYGLPVLSGSHLRKVSLSGQSVRGGLLTQAAILKVTANGTTTSPVVRGAWVMDRLLGEPPPPPPPNVPAVEPDIRGAKSIRELLQLHTREKACAGCHARFDPVGLALESFDVLGGWRTRYRGMEAGESVKGIDRAGHDFAYTLAGAVDSSGTLPDGRSFTDIRELKALLVANPRKIARNLLQQFAVYATGTPVRFSERAQIEKILDACASTEFRVGDLLEGLVQSSLFLGPPGCR